MRNLAAILVSAFLFATVPLAQADSLKAIVDLEKEGTACLGKVQVPRGTTVFLEAGDGKNDFIPLYQTVPKNSPFDRVPFIFRFDRCTKERKGVTLIEESHAWSIASPIKLATNGSTGGSGSWEMPADKDTTVELGLDAGQGQTVLKRNRVCDLASWTTRSGQRTSRCDLKILIADSPSALSQFHPDRNPETIQWQKASFINRLKNNPGPSLPGQAGVNLVVIPMPIDLPRGPGERQYYALKSIPSQEVQINLLVDDKADPSRSLALKLVDGSGTLVTHVDLEDRTIQFTADLLTGQHHQVLTYSKTYPGPVNYVLNQPSFEPAAYLPTHSTVYDLDLMAPFQARTPYGTNFGNLGKPGGRAYFSLDGKKYDNPDFPYVRLQVGVP